MSPRDLRFTHYVLLCFVAGDVYDHTSVLKMIEWRWNLRPLTVHDETANNLAEVLDFSQRNLSAPLYRVPFGPFGAPCAPESVAEVDKWERLRSVAKGYGWPLL